MIRVGPLIIITRRELDGLLETTVRVWKEFRTGELAQARAVIRAQQTQLREVTAERDTLRWYFSDDLDRRFGVGL